jgi:hypothetical protein
LRSWVALLAGVTGHVVVGDAHGRDLAVAVAVVRDHGRDLHRQAADAVAVEQVVQAVVEAGHQDQDAQPPVRVAHRPVHAAPRGERDEAGPQGVEVDRGGVNGLGHHAHEEAAGAAVEELRALDDVLAGLEQEPDHLGHDAGRVGAREA